MNKKNTQKLLEESEKMNKKIRNEINNQLAKLAKLQKNQEKILKNALKKSRSGTKKQS